MRESSVQVEDQVEQCHFSEAGRVMRGWYTRVAELGGGKEAWHGEELILAIHLPERGLAVVLTAIVNPRALRPIPRSRIQATRCIPELSGTHSCVRHKHNVCHRLLDLEIFRSYSAEAISLL